ACLLASQRVPHDIAGVHGARLPWPALQGLSCSGGTDYWAPAASARSVRAVIPSSSAQWAQQKIRPSASTPCPMIRQPQWEQVGASEWIAPSKESNTCVSPSRTISIGLSSAFPHPPHNPIRTPPDALERSLSPHPP